MNSFDVIIIGAGASGLMCALTAAQRGKKVLVLEHEKKAGKKILISGGGKCNFTNYDVSADNYLSQNPHFCKSALSRFNQYDFIALIEKYHIAYEERQFGQLFCIDSAKQILDMLLTECYLNKVNILLNMSISNIEKKDESFSIKTSDNHFNCHSLVIASGGISIPKMGATDFGYQIAKQFQHKIVRTDPGLVPFILPDKLLSQTKQLSGTALNATVSCNDKIFNDNLLFTHQGLSGPVILQISNYWHHNDTVNINLLPLDNLSDSLQQAKHKNPEQYLKSFLHHKTGLTKKLIHVWLSDNELDKKLKHLNEQNISDLHQRFHSWQVIPAKTSGFRIAEVTRGGVDTQDISSKTFMSNKINNLFFIGEVLDVTGWLGGYNFQWAWSSGFCAGKHV
ncbi:MAG: NAD(P)/FAD-dependent oxidoreductase [Gammaproteobacteria bacterium]|nr:NAD(P)/FAD-dependent oxidoreductase [Gammaproteobacteria bacterium]